VYDKIPAGIRYVLTNNIPMLRYMPPLNPANATPSDAPRARDNADNPPVIYNASNPNERYIGILYGSFIKTKDGIKVIEYNCRGGDSEIINVLDNMRTSFMDVCLSMVKGELIDIEFAIDRCSNDTNPFLEPDNAINVVKYFVPNDYPNDIGELAKMVPIDISYFQKPTEENRPRLGPPTKGVSVTVLRNSKWGE